MWLRLGLGARGLLRIGGDTLTLRRRALLKSASALYLETLYRRGEAGQHDEHQRKQMCNSTHVDACAYFCRQFPEYRAQFSISSCKTPESTSGGGLGARAQVQAGFFYASSPLMSRKILGKNVRISHSVSRDPASQAFISRTEIPATP